MLDIILKGILLTIGMSLTSFGLIVSTNDTSSFIFGKVIPIIFGAYTVIYSIYLMGNK